MTTTNLASNDGLLMWFLSLYWLTPLLQMITSELQRKQVNGLLLPWILFHELLSHTPHCISKWKGTEEMQVVAMTCIDKRGLWVTRCSITKTRGKKICLSFPISHWTEYCRHTCILYMQLQACTRQVLYHPECFSDRLHAFSNIEWEKGEKGYSNIW